MSPFGTALLVSGPEALLAQRIVADVKARALAAHPEADVNQINAAELEDAVIVSIVCDRGDRYLSTGVFPA